MLAELIEKLRKMSVDAIRPEFIEHPMLPGKVFLAQNGEVTNEHQVRICYDHRLESFDSVVDFAKVSKSPEIFINSKSLTIVADKDERLDSASLIFEFSNRFKSLDGLANKPMNSSSAIQFLRTELEGGEHVIRALRKVDFRRRSDGRRTVEHGKESLGRSVESEAQGAEEIPEFFVASVPIWLTTGFQYIQDILIFVHLDLENEAIRLIPSKDEMAKAPLISATKAIADLRKVLGDEVPIYHGRR